MPRALRRSAALALGSTLALAACDTAPGVPPLVPEPPTLAGFVLSPEAFALDGSAAEAQIPLTLAATVEDPAGAGVVVRYYVRRQGADDLVAEGTLEPSVGDQGPSTHYAATTLTLPRGATGLYTVTVLATDPEGRIGDRAVGTLRFTHESLGPPTVSAVEFPATLARPATFNVVAAVSDPDGPENLVAVELRAPSGQAFPLRDDGSGSSGTGDETAGDGRFTVGLGIGEGNAPGVYRFVVVARDVEGQMSVPDSIAITVE